MKKLAIILSVIAGIIVVIYSCKKEEKDPVLDMSQTVKSAISSPAVGSSFILAQAQADSLFAVFQWSPTTYNLDELESIHYILQMDNADSNFKHAVTLLSTTATMDTTINIGTVNQKILALGPNTVDQRNIAFRILSYINTSSSFTNIYSDAITITVTPYLEVLGYPSLWVPGDYQGWNPALAPKIYSFTNNEKYKGYIFFQESSPSFQFKFTTAPDWDHTNFGFAAEGVLSTDPTAGNLTVDSAGGYWVEVDTLGLTWTKTGQLWSVIGEWLTWSQDIDMLWNADEQYLYVTVENIPAADNQRFKFRCNHDWAVNLGAKNPDDGSLVQGGADIPIPDGGTITFFLKFTTPEPTYEIQMK